MGSQNPGKVEENLATLPGNHHRSDEGTDPDRFCDSNEFDDVPMYRNRQFMTETARSPRRLGAIAFALLLILMPAASASKSSSRILSADAWRLVTDGVMGGVSAGRLTRSEIDGVHCSHLSGRVSTANNGGFVQAAQVITPEVALGLDRFTGVRLQLRGNGEDYNVHLRTADLWLPWQSFRTTFTVTDQWQTFDLPFAEFEAYKSRAAFKPDRLRRVGVVAIGRDFDAEICVGEVGFYR